MANEVEKANPGPLPAMQAFAAGLNNVATALKAGATGTPFLKMSGGEWLYGQEDTEVEENSLWAVNPQSLQHGWASWRGEKRAKKEGAKLLGEEMVAIHEPKAARSSLPTETLEGDDDEPSEAHSWQEQMSVQLVCISGEDKGQEVLYKSSSRGFMNLMAEYVQELSKKVGAGDPLITAIVQLTVSSYKHKTYGKTYVPVWNYVEWRDQTDTSPVGEAKAGSVAKLDPEPDVEEAEKAAEAEADADDQPRRRRRRG